MKRLLSETKARRILKGNDSELCLCVPQQSTAIDPHTRNLSILSNYRAIVFIINIVYSSAIHS